MISPGAGVACGTETGGQVDDKTAAAGRVLLDAPVSAGRVTADVSCSPAVGEIPLSQLCALDELRHLRDSLLALIEDDEPLTDAQEELLLRIVEERMAQGEAVDMLLDNVHRYLDSHWCQCQSLGGDEECHWHKLFEFSQAVDELFPPLPAPPAVKGV